jgi:hypothetical protein
METISWDVADPDIEGLFQDREERWMLDCRMSFEAMDRRGLMPYTADLNLIGPDIVEVPAYLLDLLDLGQ